MKSISDLFKEYYGPDGEFFNGPKLKPAPKGMKWVFKVTSIYDNYLYYSTYEMAVANSHNMGGPDDDIKPILVEEDFKVNDDQDRRKS